MTELKSQNVSHSKPTAADLPAFRAPSAEDRRVGFGQGWVLVAGMLCLATVFMGIVWTTAPRAWRGWLVGAGVLLVTFFLLAPIAAVFTRRLYKKQRKSNRASQK